MKNTKNVLVINQYASLPKYSYGAGERMYHLSPFLSGEGYQIKVVSGGYSHLFKEYPFTPKLFNSEKKEFLEFVWVRLRRYNANSFIGRTYSWFEFLCKLFLLPLKDRPDIVVVSSMSLLPILYALWVKKKYKAKFILEIRDIWPLTPMEIGGFSKKNPLILFLRKVELLGYKIADHIISVLPGFKNYLRQNSFDHKPFTWIPNGVAQPTSNSSLIMQENSQLDKKKFNVVYAGTFGRANALDELIKAAKMLESHRKIHLTFVGDGPLEQEIKDMANHLPNVSFIPKVLKSELEPIIRDADVCYIGWLDKRIYEYGVSANKYNDYMLAKKPILSSSNIKDDPVTLSESGLQVSANDAEAIAKGIIEFFSMKEEERMELGSNGYRFVNKYQIYPVLAKKYVEVFKEVMTSPM